MWMKLKKQVAMMKRKVLTSLEERSLKVTGIRILAVILAAVIVALPDLIKMHNFEGYTAKSLLKLFGYNCYPIDIN